MPFQNHLKLVKPLNIEQKIFARNFHSSYRMCKIKNDTELTEREKYIQQIVKQFNDFSSENLSKKNILSKSIMKDIFPDIKENSSYSKTPEFQKKEKPFHLPPSDVDFKNFPKFTEKMDDLSLSEVQKMDSDNQTESEDRISLNFIAKHVSEDTYQDPTNKFNIEKEEKIIKLINNNEILDAIIATQNLIISKEIPSFSTLKKLVQAAVKKKNMSSGLDIIIQAVKHEYSELFEENYEFENLLAEKNYVEGNIGMCFSNLENICKSYQWNDEFEDTLKFILTSLPYNASEENLNMAITLVKRIFVDHNENKPIVLLWRALIESSQVSHKNIAKCMFDENPQMLCGEDDILMTLIDDAYRNADFDTLQDLTEMCLKGVLTEPLSHCLSCSLSLCCMLDNVSRAEAIFNYVSEEHIVISASSMRQYLNLLHRKKLPTPISALMHKYGLIEDSAHRKPGKKKPV